jgi:hypothetical protein
VVRRPRERRHRLVVQRVARINHHLEHGHPHNVNGTLDTVFHKDPVDHTDDDRHSHDADDHQGSASNNRPPNFNDPSADHHATATHDDDHDNRVRLLTSVPLDPPWR